MTDSVGAVKITSEFDADGIDVGIKKSEKRLDDLGKAAKKAGESGKQIGTGAAEGANKLDAATKRSIQSIERQTLSIGKSRSEYLSAKAAIDGNTAALAPYIQKLKEAEAAQAAQATAQAFAAKAALAAAATGAALAGMVKHAIDAADAMNDMSQRTGIAVKDLAAYKLAADQSGTSLEGVGKGMKKLATAIIDNGDALQKAGITATDTSGAMRQLADLFSQLPDGAQKSALATRLFGKAGEELIPLLNLGSKGLDESAKASKRYAEAMQILAPEADKFNDSMAELSINLQAAGVDIANSFLPQLNKAIESFKLAREAGIGFFQSLTGFGLRDLGDSLAESTAKAGERIKSLGNELDRLKQGLVNPDQTDASRDVLKSKIADAEKLLAYYKKIQIAAIETGPQHYDARDRSLKDAGILAAAQAAAELDKNLKGAGESAKKVKDEFGDLMNRLNTKDSGLDASFGKDLQTLFDGYKAGKLNIDEYRKAVELLIGQQKFAVDIAKEAAKAQEDFNKSLEKARQERAKAGQDVQDKAAAMERELQNYGLLESAIYDKTVADLEEARILAMKEGDAQTVIDSLDAQIDGYKRLAAAKRGIEAKDEAKKAAEDSAKAWENFSRDIEQSLTDALMRSFESGDNFGEAFAKNLQNTFKTMVLKLAVQAIVQPVMGQVQSALGVQQAGSTGSGTGGFGGMSFSQTPFSSAANSIVDSLSLSASTNQAILRAGDFLDSYGGYLNAVVQLAEGNVGSAAGAAIGQYFGGPIGSFIGSQIGGALFDGGGGPKTEWRAGDKLDNSPRKVAAPAEDAIRAVKMVFDRYADVYGIESSLKLQFKGDSDPQGDAPDQAGYQFQIGDALMQQMKGLEYGRGKGLTAEALAQRGSMATIDILGDLDLGKLANSYLDKFDIPAFLKKITIEQANQILAGLDKITMLRESTQDDPRYKELEERFFKTKNIDKYGTVAGGMRDAFNLSTEPKELVVDKYKKDGEDATAAVLRLLSSLNAANDAFEQLGLTMYDITAIGADTASKLMDAFGGLENFGAGMATYYSEFYTEQEKVAFMTGKLTDAFGDLGYSLPETRDEFRDLVESLDLTTEAGQESFAGLIGLAGGFDALLDALDGLGPVVDATTEAITESRRTLDQLMSRYAAPQTLEQAIGEINASGLDIDVDALLGSTVDGIRSTLYDLAQSLDPTTTAGQAAITAFNGLESALSVFIGSVESEAARLANVASTSRSLSIELASAQGNDTLATAMQRADELDILNELDPSGALAAIKQEIYDALDANVIRERNAEIAREQAAAAADAKRVADQIAEDQARAAERIREEWQRLGESILDVIADLRNEIVGGPQSLAKAQADLAIASAAARAGDQTAAAKLPDIARQVVDLSKSVASSQVEQSLLTARTIASLSGTLDAIKAYGFQVPAFAVGTNEVPIDMVAKVHAGERIIPAADNKALMRAINGSNVIDITPLLEEIKNLRAEVRAVAGHTAKSARSMERFDDGDALSVRVVA
jgi:hypothetical protein